MLQSHTAEISPSFFHTIPGRAAQGKEKTTPANVVYKKIALEVHTTIAHRTKNPRTGRNPKWTLNLPEL